MTLKLRRATAADAPAAGDICYRAFKAIAEAHGFPPDFPSADMAAGVLRGMIAGPSCYGLVAEDSGRVVGSNFLHEDDRISGIGPITVDPALQNDGAGRVLMEAVLRRCDERNSAGVRLVQAGYHCRSLALYLKLGFEVREHLSCLEGATPGAAPPGYTVRPVTPADIPACNLLCFRVHGHDRGGELAGAIQHGTAQLAERGGRVAAYTSGLGYLGHTVGETNDDVVALISASTGIIGPGLLIPTRNGALVRWCLDAGLRITQTLTLMSVGLYNEPNGAWLPSVLY
jgi:GNAT superfamily N-acetyltransferase